nr:uncharacterized protein LOC117605734 [Osmia lignaria]
MDDIGIQQRYLKLTKRCLIISGIWPKQTKSTKNILRFIVYITTVPCIMSQIAYVACFFSLTAVVEQLSFLLAMVLGLFKQGAYIVNEEKFKGLLNGMFNDWAVDRSKEELAIMTSYMERGALFASIYLANAYSCTGLFMQMPWWPRIADLVMPLNESRPRTYIFPAYYFIDDTNYYYWIITHMSIATVLTTIIYIACDTCYIYAVQHACGLLAVAG